MRTVHEVSEITGVSIRTLQYYDKIGLLPPSRRTGAEYRLYDETALARLQEILLFRELEFSLKEIRDILAQPGYDRSRVVRQQIELLELKRAHLDNLITFARGIQTTGADDMDFSAFDSKKAEQYKQEAKARWGQTEAFQEYEKKNAARSQAAEKGLAAGMMSVFQELGALREGAPDAPEAQALVKKLQSFITEHYYRCTPQILASLGQMYAAGGEMTDNIDAAGGAGTADFAARAIAYYCR